MGSDAVNSNHKDVGRSHQLWSSLKKIDRLRKENLAELSRSKVKQKAKSNTSIVSRSLGNSNAGKKTTKSQVPSEQPRKSPATPKDLAVEKFKKAAENLEQAMPKPANSYLSDSVNVKNLRCDSLKAIEDARQRMTSMMSGFILTKEGVEEKKGQVARFVLDWFDTVLPIAKSGFDVVSVSLV